MKIAIFVILATVSAWLTACSAQNAESGKPAASGNAETERAETVPPAGRQPVLVELFTSEGCSSCPPADRQLAFLEKDQPVNGAEVITLAFHVDYWDRLGWKDAFSSAAFSERQNGYVQRMGLSSSYTPQMIVDGHAEFVGSDGGRAADAIAKAANTPKPRIDIETAGVAADIEIRDIAAQKSASVYLAIAEDNLETDVKRGENVGRKLPHISVVRKLGVIGRLSAGENKFTLSAPIQLQTGWKREDLKIVVFVQEDENGRVLAVGRAKV